jgi:hypothetical protein
MKRFMIAAVLLSTVGFGGAAHAQCATAGGAAGVSDIWRAQFGALRLTIRTIGSPLTVNEPPSGVQVCSDGSGGVTRALYFTLRDTDTNTVLCDTWIDNTPTGVPPSSPEYLGFDPFGFGMVLGAGIHIPNDGAHPCGVNAAWDPVGYATNVALGYASPTRLRFPDTEHDKYGASAGLGIGSIVSGSLWWTTADGKVTKTVTDEYNGSYARGVGVATWGVAP